MKTLLGVFGGLWVGGMGAGVGVLAAQGLDKAGLLPSVKNPGWRKFAQDSLLVLGCAPGAMIGWNLGKMAGGAVSGAVAKVT